MNISRESKSAIKEYYDRIESEKKLNADKLNQEISAAIEKSGLETSPYLVQEVAKRFEVKQDQIKATSVFKSIPDFLDNYKVRIQKDAQGNAMELSVQDRIEQRNIEKKQKFEEMVYWSRSGNIDQYKKARTAWAAL